MKEEEDYPIGSIVRIVKDSRFYRQGQPSNPIDITGKIVGNDGFNSLNYKVIWNNKRDNRYSKSDLELVVKQPEINNTYPIY